ncbi:hypothetical protein HDE_02459 [Halotydeus destructor]|nr:hypothetical protein HDE_02459 [Halotydeus destructor]
MLRLTIVSVLLVVTFLSNNGHGKGGAEASSPLDAVKDAIASFTGGGKSETKDPATRTAAPVKAKKVTKDDDDDQEDNLKPGSPGRGRNRRNKIFGERGGRRGGGRRGGRGGRRGRGGYAEGGPSDEEEEGSNAEGGPSEDGDTEEGSNAEGGPSEDGDAGDEGANAEGGPATEETETTEEPGDENEE